MGRGSEEKKEERLREGREGIGTADSDRYKGAGKGIKGKEGGKRKEDKRKLGESKKREIGIEENSRSQAKNEQKIGSRSAYEGDRTVRRRE